MGRKTNEKKNKNRSADRKARFTYWFDNHMANGSLGLIRILLISTILVVILIATAILICGFADREEAGSVFWETISTVINAWMPSYEDGSLGYVILMSVAAISGLLVTSVLIGIFSSAIEERINNLKNGNSAIIEKDHIVVLGHADGSYALLQQLVDASADDKRCIVVACEKERSELEDELRDNLEIPKNVRLVCRNIDIYDSVSLKKCCIENAQAVIVNPGNNVDTVKALLAVSSILGTDNPNVYVCSAVTRSRYLLPASFAKEHHITQLLTNRLLSKVIAHSCTQPGLSETLTEFLDYDGCNLYEVSFPEAVGITFGDLVIRLTGGVPIGTLTGGRSLLNPDPGYRIGPDEKLLVFTEFPDDLILEPEAEPYHFELKSGKKSPGAPVLILGVNDEITTVLRELPENVETVRIAGADADAKDEINEYAESIRQEGRTGFSVEFVRDRVPTRPDALARLVGDASHVVLLNDYDLEEDEADTEIIMRIITLRVIREEKDLHFNITAELRRESSSRLVTTGDSTDFIVATNIVSMFLSQLADRPNMESVFRELLSNEGNEIYLKTAEELSLPERITVREARGAALSQHYVLLGLMDEKDGAYMPVFNPPVSEELMLDEKDRLIVLGVD
ncbi:MAG: hypothetical protein J5744_06085 [Oscillospiraceae bacterium]|nr:hypothetical protein [Oscillospiraceae bacterium]